MAARVCVGGAGAGAEPTPPTLTHSAPQPGRSARCLFFCSAPTAPGSSPPPASLPPSPPPRSYGDPPTPGSPAQTRLPVPPRPSRRLPGIQWSGGKTRPNVPLGEGRGDPLPRPLRPLPSPSSPPFGEEEGNGAADGDFPAGGGEPSSPPLTRPLRPLPKCLLGMPGRNGASGKLWRDGCGRRPPGLPLPTAPKQ